MSTRAVLKPIACAFCSQLFIPAAQNQTLCSDECRALWRNDSTPHGRKQYGGENGAMAEDAELVELAGQAPRATREIVRMLAVSESRQQRAVIYRHLFGGESVDATAAALKLTAAQIEEIIESARQRDREVVRRLRKLGGKC